ncbi:molybdopterin-guanine dinucleotide biosynthesis protein MobA [Bacillus mobilis]|nr:molybdopterin-guanine dinucleotide biosynthesis protein MobA [Bacillus mobilis]HDR7243184.1 MobA/MobL family protein [Bacillus mobilis]
MRGMGTEKMFHTRTRIFKKSNKDKIIAKIAYRAGVKMVDEMSGKTYNYSAKGVKDGIQSEILLPKDAGEKWKDRAYLYNEVQRGEKYANAQYLREIEFALSNEFSPQENIEIAKKAAQKLVDKGMVADLHFHKLNDNNPHCHMVLTMRKITKEGKFDTLKARDWNKPSIIQGFRKNLEKLLNEKYKEKGLDMYVDRRSYKERGLDLIPQKHLPPQKDSKEYKEIAKENKKIKRINKMTKQKEKSRQEAVSDYVERKEAMVQKSKEKTLETTVEKVVDVPILSQKELVLERFRKEVKSMQMEQKKNQEQNKEFEGHGYYNQSGTKQDRRDPKKTVTVEQVYKEEASKLKKEEREKNMEHSNSKKKRATAYETLKKKTQQANRLIEYKKDDIAHSKLRVMELKAEKKGLSSFSLTDLKQKRQIKRDIAKEKVLQKKKKLEIRKERRVIKEARKEYGKHIKAQINKFKEKIQQHMKARKHEKEMDRLHEKTLKQELKDVVSFEDYKKKRDKDVQLKTFDEVKMEKQKQKEQKNEQGLER